MKLKLYVLFTMIIEYIKYSTVGTKMCVYIFRILYIIFNIFMHVLECQFTSKIKYYTIMT